MNPSVELEVPDNTDLTSEIADLPDRAYKKWEDEIQQGDHIRFRANEAGVLQGLVISARVVCVTPDQRGTRVQFSYTSAQYEFWINRGQLLSRLNRRGYIEDTLPFF